MEVPCFGHGGGAAAGKQIGKVAGIREAVLSREPRMKNMGDGLALRRPAPPEPGVPESGRDVRWRKLSRRWQEPGTGGTDVCQGQRELGEGGGWWRRVQAGAGGDKRRQGLSWAGRRGRSQAGSGGRARQEEGG